MTPEDSETTSTERGRMVERQLRRRGITDEPVLNAMETVPRELFLPEGQRKRAYRDGAVRIGEGQTMSQPWIVACMAQLLELDGSETVLELGTGSGYAAAVLSLLAREVVTIERVGRLAERASSVLAELGYDNVEVRTGDGSLGAPDRAPFGGISVTAAARNAAAPRSVRPSWPLEPRSCARSNEGARELLVRFRDGEEEAVAAVRFVPLLGGLEAAENE